MLTIRGLRREGLGPVDLDVDRGDCVAVMGPSGSGKTLFLRAIADLDPSEGDVALDGAARGAMPAPAWRRRVIYVAGEPGWWGDTVGYHFADTAAATPLVVAMGLPPEVFEWPVERLSTGERQRLGLARALVQAPSVLLLDEPTSGLDGSARDRIEALLRDRMNAGTTILAVTHDPAQAGRLAKRTLHFAAGAARESSA